jgi:hypothetical protein
MTFYNMLKRARAATSASPPSNKPHLESASPDAAAVADADSPLRIFLRTTLDSVPTESTDAVAYWMRMEDMRSESTHSLSLVLS